MNSNWDFGNNLLYDMCKNNFQHEKDEIIITKVLFIGRIYAAAIERRKNKGKTNINNDNFYIKIVAPTIRLSKIDEQLTILKSIKRITAENLHQILKVHYYLMKTISKITDLEKRSFCSKYLHFHLPELFFIYDSRASNALKTFIAKVPIDLHHILKLKNIDHEYAKYFCKCFDLKSKLEQQHKTKLTNREFDNILIQISNNKTYYQRKR